MGEYRKIFYAIFIAIVVVSGIIYFYINDTNKIEKIIIEDEPEVQIEAKKEDEEIEKHIFIHLCGSVNQEGVYKVLPGTRIFELVEMAGGLSQDAATDAVNQAREVKDGELIFFPTKEAVINGEFNTFQVTNIDSDLININTAMKDQLMTLPGIGEAKANSIIKFREANNDFKTIEEIMLIPGIKESIFQNIRDLITI